MPVRRPMKFCLAARCKQQQQQATNRMATPALCPADSTYAHNVGLSQVTWDPPPQEGTRGLGLAARPTLTEGGGAQTTDDEPAYWPCTAASLG